MTIKCRDIPARADDYVDRNGSMADRLFVALHLASCPHCRTYVRGLRLTKRLAAASFVAQSPDAALTRLGLGDGRSPDIDKGSP